MRRQKSACHAVLFVLIMMMLGGCSSEKEPIVTEKPLETTAGTTAAGVPERVPDTVLIPPLPDCYTESEQASATLNGEKLPVIHAFEDYDYCPFSFSGKAEVTIDIGERIRAASVSPLAKEIPYTVDGTAITITMEKPEYLIVKLNTKREIVLLADPVETDAPAAEGNGVWNAVSLGADATGRTSATAVLQSAVDAASEADGGTVYVPAGVYSIGNLELKSNVHLYLEAGAVLRGDRTDEFIEFCRRTVGDTEFPTTYLLYSKPGCKNIRITGRGTIDARGFEHYSEKTWLVCGFVPNRCNGLVMDGVTVRDTGHWGTIIVYSKNVEIRNTKHLNKTSALGQNDGIDIVGSSDVTVSRTAALSRDDPYSVKTYVSTYMFEGVGRAAENIVFEDCLAWTRCGAFKLGWGVSMGMNDITFRDSYVYNCNNGLLVTHYGGTALISGITFENIDIENFQLADSKWLLADIGISKPGKTRSDWGSVSGVTIRNINIRSTWSGQAVINGHDDAHMIRDVALSEITVRGEKCETLADMKVSANRFSKNVSVNGNPVS